MHADETRHERISRCVHDLGPRSESYRSTRSNLDDEPVTNDDGPIALYVAVTAEKDRMDKSKPCVVEGGERAGRACPFRSGRRCKECRSENHWKEW